MDKIVIRDLLLRGILGINPEERENRQDLLINLTLWADTRPAARSDRIEDAVNYRSITKEIIGHVEASSDFLVERLVDDLARLVLTRYPVARLRLRLEKPGALRFARSVGVEVERTREDYD